MHDAERRQQPEAEQHRDDEAERPAPTTKPTNFSEVTRSTVQPGGLPATSSLCRIRSLWSAGVSFLPRPSVRSSERVEDAVLERRLELLAQLGWARR